MKIEKLLNHLQLNKTQKAQFSTNKNDNHLPQNEGEESSLSTQHQTLVLLLKEKMSESEQKILLQTWQKMNLALTEKQLITIINLLQENPDLDQELIIKTGAFLARNGLLIIPSLADNILSFLDENQSLTSTLNYLFSELSFSNNNQQSSSELSFKTFTKSEDESMINSQPINNDIQQNLEQLIGTLVFSAKNSTNDYQLKLENLSSLLKQVFNFGESNFSDKLINSETKDKLELLSSQAKGEFLLNFQKPPEQQEILLFLELPLHFPGQDNLRAFYLKVSREKNKSSSEQKDKLESYNISFLVDLPTLGPIKTKLIITGKKIEPQFQTTKQIVQNVIKQKIGELENKLNQLGFQLSEPTFNTKEKDTNWTLNSLFDKIENSKGEKEVNSYSGFDITI